MGARILDAALSYMDKGYPVIPAKPTDKRPALPEWTSYQKTKPTRDQIVKWFTDTPDTMLGFVTGKVSNLLVVDCDTEEAYEWLQEQISDTLLTPIARTPRGGRHVYFTYPEGSGLTVGADVRPEIKGLDFRGEGGFIVAPPSTNGTGGAYQWLDGLGILEVPPAAPPAQLIALLKEKALYACGATCTPQNANPDFFSQGRRDEDLFHTANLLIKAGADPGFVRKVLEGLANQCDPPFPLREIEGKLQSALRRQNSREGTLSDEVRDWILSSSGVILSSDVSKCLHLSSREDQKNLSKILGRLVQEGLIEKTGRRAGEWRRIDTEAEKIEWWKASTDHVKLWLPLGLEDLVLIYPKSIIVIAGTQNAGKTALALNIALQNARRMTTRYLSSEMGAEELHKRLANFHDVPDETWRKVDFRQRSSNFADLILPDGLVVIDYYEVSDRFFLIAEEMRLIFEKLKTGVAVVCLQKSSNKDAGRGGDFSLEKPRLYLNLDDDTPNGTIMTIRKAKAWATERNPNHLRRRFKTVKGARIIAMGEWGEIG